MLHEAKNESIQFILNEKINNYLNAMDSNKITNFYELYLSEIEPALFEAVMQKAKYNQVRAAKILGISRGTLRKKLKLYFDDKYCGTRDIQ